MRQPNIHRMVILSTFIFAVHAHAQKITIDRNATDRKQWFSNLGFGMLVRWSADAQFGPSSGMRPANASENYKERYFSSLAAQFTAEDFNPVSWAQLARRAGMKYLVFSAKMADGFCMWDTKTTDFNIMKSAFGRDALAQVITACRQEGLGVGIYFSPIDFHQLYRQGIPTDPNAPEAQCTRNAQLWQTNQQQLRELLQNYGKIDLLYIDSDQDWANLLVANFAWDIGSELVITRGGMPTPTYLSKDQPPAPPFEQRMAMHYFSRFDQSVHTTSAKSIIDNLIKARAGGGNLLLDIQPDAAGRISSAEEAILRLVGEWMFTNREALTDIDKLKTSGYQDIPLTRSKDGKYIYAFVNTSNIKSMENQAFFFPDLKGTPNTLVSILGQSALWTNYKQQPVPNPVIAVTDHGIFVHPAHVSASGSLQGLPLVLRFEEVQPDK